MESPLPTNTKTALLGIVHLSIGRKMTYITLDGWQTIKNDICLKSAQKQGMGLIEEYLIRTTNCYSILCEA